ncbi:D-amino-acid oxidase [Roseibium aquae]|uniref:D-amino-acid oxidase n=1 Tax=Roseibium aquae TaxID=1323746 RepID=A0A916TM22_9HYPH|nr:FAD-binding oxidoreductase [Roseibium aquae]GGB57879.1 D-amino-acid oxidase [Roseibium aquae]
MKVIVVGAGFCGSVLAYRLARVGLDVQVLEAGVPELDNVTAHSMGWINVFNANALDDVAGYRFRQDAVRDHARLAAELGAAWPIRKTGAVVWQDDPAQTQTFVEQHQAAGTRIERIAEADFTRLLPSVPAVPSEAAFLPDDMALEPGEAARLLCSRAEGLGAQITYGAGVQKLVVSGDRVSGVETANGHYSADAVVLACGTACGSLLRPLGLEDPVDGSPAALVRLRSNHPLNIGPIVCAPRVEVRQRPDGTLMSAASLKGRSDARIGRDTVRALEDLFPASGGLEVLETRIANRPVSRSGEPLKGPVASFRGLWLFAMHPGLILAPYARA